MINAKYFLGALAMVFTLTSCDKNDVYDLIRKRVVNFSVEAEAGQVGGSFIDNNINNVSVNEILVHSDQCSDNQNAVYSLVSHEEGLENMMLPNGNAQLYWNETVPSQDFVAAYPASKVSMVSGNMVQFAIPTIQSDAESFNYSVASARSIKDDAQDVRLSLKSVMTTLEVSLENVDMTDVATVSFTAAMPCDGNGSFTCDAVRGIVVDALSEQTITWVRTKADTQSLVVALPSVQIDQQNAVKFVVECNDGKLLKTILNPATAIKAGSKAQVSLSVNE